MSDLLPPADDAGERDDTPGDETLPVNFGLSDSEVRCLLYVLHRTLLWHAVALFLV